MRILLIKEFGKTEINFEDKEIRKKKEYDIQA